MVLLEYNNDVHKLLIQALPIIIVWNLWKNRCSAKYAGKSSSTSRVKFLIFKDIYHLLSTTYPYIQWPSNWKDLFNMIENCNHELKTTKVSWIKPPADYLKLNTDGSALGNPGKIGGGGILRNNQGTLIYAFTVPLGVGTNNQAELQAALFGITWCVQQGHRKIILEI